MRSRGIVLALGLLTVVVGSGWLRSDGDAGLLMVGAADGWLKSLNEEQRAKAVVPFDSPARMDWHFIPKDKRKGLQIKEMSGEQRQAAMALLRQGVSQIGYQKASVIMGLEAILKELEKTRKNGPLRDTERYYFSVFGEPGKTGRWGWSCEGHHLSLNFVIADGKLVSATPAFYGANPAQVKTEVNGSAKSGHQTLAKEESLAFELVASLKEAQRPKAVLAAKAPADIRNAGAKSPPDAAPQGISASELEESQKALLWKLIETYAGNMPAEFGQQRLAEIREAGMDKVHFAWFGADKPGIGHAYIIQGPTFQIELNNTQPDAEGNIANHIHSMWRTPTNDFGQAK